MPARPVITANSSYVQLVATISIVAATSPVETRGLQLMIQMGRGIDVWVHGAGGGG